VIEELPIRSLVFSWSKASPPVEGVVARLMIVTIMAWLTGNQLQWRLLENAYQFAIGVDWMPFDPVIHSPIVPANNLSDMDHEKLE